MEQRETYEAPAARNQVPDGHDCRRGRTGSDKIVIAIWALLLFGCIGAMTYSRQKTAAEAQRLLNRAYDLYGQREFAESTECLRQAAELGNAWAQLYYGGHLKNGIGTNPDMDAALKWYRKSAALNCPEAFMRLGECYEFGEGVARDPNEAETWYRKAVKAEFGPDAQIALERVLKQKAAAAPGPGSN